jgi:hypothetical protein
MSTAVKAKAGAPFDSKVRKSVFEDGELAYGSRDTLCQERWPHWGQRRYQRGSPAAFQRIPPISQIDRANPHRHRTFHDRECASMLSAQRWGTIRMKNFWKKDSAIRRRVLTTELQYIRPPRSRVCCLDLGASVGGEIEFHGGGGWLQ